ncbi:HD domain-containing protein [Musicola paradisiaca]|uniref:Metal dependent phosphohydrolase n=1 Tax=Musicola paradisiaca (strain Ech703) TaxID=579405 RepID=C6CDX6_MUSP7|nr:HD domain-containing protein [Musicola paradisiaca]ACS87070.1 metal dependent phosphohydrolase [Musicola paradisiaca Ech703]
MSQATPVLDFGSMTDVVRFLIEIDKLKTVQRRTKIIGTSRQEDSAEHSWHFAVSVMSLAPFAGPGVDIQRVIQMALLHDIVEIDVGDVLVYDLQARAAVEEQEQAAARRIFGLLPEPQSSHFLQLWQEYEMGETPSARFAQLVDRVIPILINLHNQGQSWVENGIRLEQVINRNAFIESVNPELWRYLQQHLREAHRNGWLK